VKYEKAQELFPIQGEDTIAPGNTHASNFVKREFQEISTFININGLLVWHLNPGASWARKTFSELE
jgi:hypothetical protein